jgi:DNA polymerase III alpha subunit
VFNDDYEQYKHLFKIDELIFVEGEVIFDSFRNEVKVNASKILLLDDVLTTQVSALDLDLRSSHDWAQIKQTIALGNDNSSALLRINYSNQEAECKLRLAENYRVLPHFVNLEKLTEIIGKSHWRLVLNKV